MDKDLFFKSTVPKTTKVPITDSGDTVTIRQFSAQDLVDYVDAENEKLRGARSIVASVMNGEGLMFTEADIPQIMAMSAEVFSRLNVAINQLNNLSNVPAKN